MPAEALRLKLGFGEFSIGLTAGKGIDGAGEEARPMAGEEPKDDLRLCDVGGFIGLSEDGVPGTDEAGAGEPGAFNISGVMGGRVPPSGGAGLLEDIRLAGRSILVTLLC